MASAPATRIDDADAVPVCTIRFRRHKLAVSVATSVGGSGVIGPFGELARWVGPLPPSADFAAPFGQAWRATGHMVEVAKAGVSGDTAAGGLARLDWSVPDGTDAVIVELGANDMLRGFDPKVTQRALEEIVRRLSGRCRFG